jgi:hypothetical protein
MVGINPHDLTIMIFPRVNCLFRFSDYFSIIFFSTLTAYAVAELDTGVLMNIGLHLVPVALSSLILLQNEQIGRISLRVLISLAAFLSSEIN